MKTAQLLVLALAGVVSVPLLAGQAANGTVQQAGAAPSLSDGAPTLEPNALPPGSASASAAAAHAFSLVVSEMRPVSGVLEGKLNSQTAHPGDRVIVKTTQSMVTADGTEVPKGSRLVGHVVAAQAYSNGAAVSQLRIVFDRAELRGGGNVPIHSMIQTIAPPGRVAGEQGYGGGMAGGPAMDAENAGPGDGMGGGGMSGQGGIGAPGGAPMGSAGVEDASMNEASDAATMTGGVPGSMGAPMYNVIQLSDSLAPRFTGFPGVMLQADASGASSGTLFAPSQSIRLNSGSRVILGIVATGEPSE